MNYQYLMQYIDFIKRFTPEEEGYLNSLVGNKEYFKDIIITPNIIDLLSDDNLYQIDTIESDEDLLLTILHDIYSVLAFLIAIYEDDQYYKLSNPMFDISCIYEEYNNYVQEHGVPKFQFSQ